MPLDMKIRSAEILMDGTTARIQFDTKNDEGYIDGMPDYMPASGEGLVVALSNGAILEPISIMSTDYNAWHAGYASAANASANLAPGQANHYWGAVAFVNPSGIEEMITQHMGAHGSAHPRMMTVSNGHMLSYYWQQPIPSGWSVNIYISDSGRNNPTWDTLRMVASGITKFAHNGNFQLYGSGRYNVLFRSSGTEPLAPRILSWTGIFAIPHDKIVQYEQEVALTIPSGYIRDKFLNKNLGYTNYPIANFSMVNASGFVTDSLGTHVSGKIVYFSPLYGNDINAGTDITAPKANFRAYWQSLPTFGAGNRVVLKCRRGEVHPLIGGPIAIKRGSYNSFKDPLIIEDYWHDYGGPDNVDPKTRPIISGLTQGGDFASFTGAPGIDRAPNILFRRLHFFDAGFNILRSVDNLTISDCISTNGTLGFNGEASFNHGRINIHRCIIVDNARSDGGHVQGSFTAQTQRVLYSQCVFDKNGYVKTLPPITGSETVFSHTFYMQHSAKEALIIGNWISSGGGVACQIRGGGAFCYNNIINCNFGPFILDDTGYLSNNTILYSESLNGGAGGRGMEMQSKDYVEKKYVLAEKNLTANTILSGISQTPFAFSLANGATGDSFDSRRSIREEIRNNTFINNGEIGLNHNETSGNVYFHRNIVIGGRQGQRPFSLYFITAPFLPVTKFIINDNYYVSGSRNPTPFWQSVTSRALSFNQWVTSGHDTRSIMASAPTFSNSGANWGTYGEFCGLGDIGHREFVDNILRVRPPGVWGRQYNPIECSRFLRTAFMPTNIPSLNDSPSGFYGAMDYRLATLQVPSGEDLTGNLIRYIKSLLKGGFCGY